MKETVLQSRVLHLHRARSLPDAGGETLYFVEEGGSRKKPAKFFDPRDVPAFDGERASFFAEQVRLKGWVLRHRVNRDGTPYEAKGDAGADTSSPPTAPV